MIGEVGWPSAGRMREGALPAPASQARFVQEMMAAAKRGHYRLNIIEAFDQPWKRQSEGTVGGHWGLIAADGRTIKFDWGVPVSNHPLWKLQAAGGIAFAAVIFAAAFVARRREPAVGLRAWAGVAAIAFAAGATIGWTVENVPLESLAFAGWAMSLAMAGLAVLCPLAAAVALTRGTGRPAFAAMLGGAPPAERDQRALGVLALVLCVVVVALALGLTFDPRYRDFPFAPLTAAVAAFLVLALAGRAQQPPSGTAEAIAAAALAPCAVYIAWHEGFANWQSLWLCAVLVAFAVTLAGVPGARRQGS
jgi:glucan 1,3-beta-glucosidase